MSAFTDDDGHFLASAQRDDLRIAQRQFREREVYGDYLEWLLASQAALPDPGRFVHLVGHVHDLQVAMRRRAVAR